MKTAFAIIFFGVLSITFGYSQVKIGNNPQNIDPSSLLELESTTGALVITRVNDGQMASLTPLQGALVYNTDQSCVFYYDGGEWINLCSEQNTTNVSLELQDTELILTDSDGNTVSAILEEALQQTFSTDPIINFRESIVITQNGNNFNFEVSEITGDNIVDSSINGIDLQDNSITDNKLAPNSVGQEELQDNAVADLEIDYDRVTLNDFTNDAGYITSAQLISPEPNNAITDINGAFYDDTLLRTQIETATDNINGHLSNDGDLNDQNEWITSMTLDGTELVITEGANEQRIDLGSFDNAGSDEQDIATNGNPGNISIDNGSTITLNVNDGDFDDQNEIQDAVAVDIDPIIGITGGNVQLALEELQTDVDNLIAGGGNTDEQDLANVLGQGNDAGGNQIENLQDPNDDQDAATKKYVDDEILALPASSDNQNLTGATLDGSNLLTIDIEDGNSTSVDLSSLAGTGTDNQNLTGATLDGSNLLTIDIEDGNSTSVDLSSLASADDQNASEVPFTSYVTLAGPSTQLAIQQLKDELDAATIGGGGENPTNELQDILLSGTIVSLTIPATVGNQIDLDPTFVTETELTTALTGIDTDDQNADEVPYDNTSSGLTATDTQAAIDELAASGVVDTDEQQLTLETGNLLTLEDGGTPIDLTPFLDNTDEQDATQVEYDNSTSGLVADDVQEAIDELAASGVVDTDEQQLTLETGNLLTLEDGGTPIDLTPFLDNTDEQDATQVEYDNSTSGLVADDVQEAIDELAASGVVDTDEQQLTLETGNLLTLEDGGTPIDLTPFLDNTDEQDATQVEYDNSTSGLVADDVQEAIDELAASGVVDTDEQQLTLETGNLLTLEDGGTPIDLTPFLDNTDEQDATQVEYDNSTSGLVADDVQEAIDELAASGVVDTDEQQLTLETGNLLTLEDGGTPIDLTPFLDNTDEQDATQVEYDNSTSGLVADDVQEAIDELAASGVVDTDEQQLTLETGNLLTLEDGGTPIDLTPFLDNTDEQDATQVEYDNSTSGLVADDVQEAIDELAASGVVDTDEQQLTLETGNLLTLEDGGTPIDLTPFLDNTDEQDATQVEYDNSTSGLVADDVQEAIDELAASGVVDTDEQQLTLETGNLLTLEDGGTPIDLTPFLDNTDEQDATQVEYDNSTSGLVADDVQEAIDELDTAIDGFVGTLSGTANSIPFFNSTGDGLDEELHNGGQSFYWNPSARLGSGALFIGLDDDAGTAVESTDAKVQIVETVSPGIAFPLQLQNRTSNNLGGDAVGVLFATEGAGSYGKGALVYERTGSFAVGDFHFLQNSAGGSDTNNPDLADTVMTIKNNGNVGIGIDPTEKLHVDGNILATGTITPDYVFQKYYKGESSLNPEYKMMSLGEIANFTKQNNHLPGVPSAMEVQQKGGIILNRAAEINLEKIEELFLHTIEQEKKIKNLEAENEKLALEVQAMKKDMEAIKALLLKKND